MKFMLILKATKTSEAGKYFERGIDQREGEVAKMFDKSGFDRSINGGVENGKTGGSMQKFLVAIFLFAASSANAQQIAPASKLPIHLSVCMIRMPRACR